MKFKSKERVDIERIQKAVTKAGFSVSDFVMTVKFNNVAVKNKSKFVIKDDAFYLLDIKEKTLDGLVDVRVLHKDFMSKKAYKKVKKKVIYAEKENVYNVTLS